MNAVAADLPTLHFRGEPASLDSFLAISADELGQAPRVALKTLGSFPVPLAVVAVDMGAGVSRLHLSIPRTTPPGDYTGSAELAGKVYPVEVHIEPHAYLSLSPRQLVLSGHAGEQLRADLTLANCGNVACEIGKTHTFGLYDIDGVERGIGAAFLQTADRGANRAEHLLEKLAAGHGGLVQAQLTKGVGPIAPGELRQLELALHLPGELSAGHTYSGVWALENLRYFVKIRATRKRR
jgi:hypothetical protein